MLPAKILARLNVLCAVNARAHTKQAAGRLTQHEQQALR
jgi:hypothetical protein